MRPIRPEPSILAAVSTWEALALLTGKLPTVTSMVMRLPRPARSVLVAATSWWLIVHFEVKR